MELDPGLLLLNPRQAIGLHTNSPGLMEEQMYTSHGLSEGPEQRGSRADSGMKQPEPQSCPLPQLSCATLSQ